MLNIAKERFKIKVKSFFFTTLLVVFLLIVLLTSIFSAQTEQASQEVKEEQAVKPSFEEQLNDINKKVEAGILPDSPFYSFKLFLEKVRLFFTFNPEKKIKAKAEFASRRVAEMAKLRKQIKEARIKGLANVERRKLGAFERASREYSKLINDLEKETLITKNAELESLINKTITRHVIVLNVLRQGLPEESEKGVSNAMINSGKVLEKVGGRKINITLPNKEICFYTLEYKPVCGTDGKIYTNAGQARCNGVGVAYYLEEIPTELAKALKENRCDPNKKKEIMKELEKKIEEESSRLRQQRQGLARSSEESGVGEKNANQLEQQILK